MKIRADGIDGSIYANGAVDHQLIISSVAPSLLRDVLVVGCSRFIRLANVLLCILGTVTVDLHYALDLIILGGINKDANNVLIITENIVGSTSYDDTATVIGNLADNLILPTTAC